MPTPTDLLYHQTPAPLAFDARVIAHGTWGGRPSWVLDRTAFYPESGGQMADRGTLAGVSIADVQIDDDGVVHHLLEGEPLPVGTEVRGAIEPVRRRLHMALHTGQHMLSAALLDVCRAETVSSRLGETSCTIDVDLPALVDADVARAESLVNAVIDADVPVRAWFPEAGELATLPLRRAPKVTEHVRVVEVADFDVSPCGGTHVSHTSQIGLLHVAGIERYKGKMRVVFSAGARARHELRASAEQIRTLARELTCGADAISAAIEKVRREGREAREALGAVRSRLAESTADALRGEAHAGVHVVRSFDGESVEFLRQVASRVTGDGDRVAWLAAPTTDGIAVVVSRGAASTFDCGSALKQIASTCGGRGGGRADRAEGRLPTGSDWTSLVAAVTR